MTLTLEQWFDIVCDDLDPERKWERPRLRRDWLPLNINGLFATEKNLVVINVMKENSLATLAHELRHWFQCFSGKLQDNYVREWGLGLGVDVIGTWEGREYFFSVCTTEEYFALPWEADAEAYAKDVMQRLLPTSEVA